MVVPVASMRIRHRIPKSLILSGTAIARLFVAVVWQVIQFLRPIQGLTRPAPCVLPATGQAIYLRSLSSLPYGTRNIVRYQDTLHQGNQADSLNRNSVGMRISDTSNEDLARPFRKTTISVYLETSARLLIKIWTVAAASSRKPRGNLRMYPRSERRNIPSRRTFRLRINNHRDRCNDRS